MKILLDTSAMVEFLLDQPRADEVERLLQQTSLEELCLTVFALDSIGVLFMRHKMFNEFVEFVDDWLIEGGMNHIALQPDDMRRVTEIVQQFNLDFDDAYQYVTAEKHNLILVSFDAHFDKTPRGRKTPADLLRSP